MDDVYAGEGPLATAATPPNQTRKLTTPVHGHTTCSTAIYEFKSKVLVTKTCKLDQSILSTSKQKCDKIPPFSVVEGEVEYLD
jgi:hypothetical protein